MNLYTGRAGMLLACVGGLAAALPANAAMQLMLDDPTTAGIEVTVGDVDGDGVISYSGAVGGFSVNVTTGVSKPMLNGPQWLGLDSIDVSGGAGELIIRLTDTGYTGTPAELEAAYGGTTVGTVDLDFLYDAANAEFGGTSFFDPAAGTAPSFSGAGASPVSLTGPYSLTIVADISHSGSGSSSLGAQISAVPVPAAIWLFGSGLLGLAGFSARRI